MVAVMCMPGKKGASDAEIRQMDVWMQNYVEIAKKNKSVSR